MAVSIGPILVAGGVTGCAGASDKYPSLAIRDRESAQGQFSPVAVTDPAPVAPVASVQDINALVARAMESHTKFKRAQVSTTVLVGQVRGQGIEGNARQRALLLLADLTALRSDTALPMGDLDLLKAEAATTFAPTEAIDEARESVLELLEEQDGALNALWTDLSP